MATFEYEAVIKGDTGEEHFEHGFLVAPSRTAAEQKLKELQLEPRKIHQITGIKGFLKSLTADIK